MFIYFHSFLKTFIQGFLCPTCMVNFPSAEAVQAHFEKEHGGDADAIDEVQGVGFSES